MAARSSVLRGWEKAGGGFGGAGEGEDDGACECDVLRYRRQTLGSRAGLGRVRPEPDPIFFSLKISENRFQEQLTRVLLYPSTL